MVMVIDNGLKRRENHSLKLRRKNDNVDVEIEEEELHRWSLLQLYNGNEANLARETERDRVMASVQRKELAR